MKLGSKIMATKITRDVLQSYLRCKTKAHLKLAGQHGSVSDYEALLAENRRDVRQSAIGKIVEKYPDNDVVRDITLTAAALRAGPSIVLDATLEDDLLSLDFDGLQRVEGPSKLGDFHYVPMLLQGGRKVGKEQRLSLELSGLVLSYRSQLESKPFSQAEAIQLSSRGIRIDSRNADACLLAKVQHALCRGRHCSRAHRSS